MADVATPSAAIMFDANTEKKKPEKPDEELYKANLKKAEKEHADAKAKFVSAPIHNSPEKYLNLTCIWHV
jgi:hypothetical protein